MCGLSLMVVFKKLLTKFSKKKQEYKDSIYFLKISDRKTQGMKDGINKYEVNDEDGLKDIR